MNLFDSTKLDFSKTQPHSGDESIFSYVESANIPKIEKVRSLLDLWFADYPADAKSGFKRRMMSDNQFGSRLFELAVYSTFRKLGANIRVEVEGLESKNRPDFLVTLKNGLEFYVECICVSLESDDALSQRRIERQLIDILNAKLSFLRSYWSVQFLSHGPSDLHIDSVITLLQSYGCSVESICSSTLAGTVIFKQDDWHLKFTCRRSHTRKAYPNDAGPLTLHLPSAQVKEKIPEARIYSAIAGKAKKDYPRDRPLAIAVAAPVSAWLDDSALATFGVEVWTADMEADAKMFAPKQMRFWKESSLSHSHVFSVIAFTDFGLGGLGRSSIVSYERPFGEFPNGFHDLGFGSCRVRDKQIVLTVGPTLGEIHRLPAGWPTGQVFTDFQYDAIEVLRLSNPPMIQFGPL